MSCSCCHNFLPYPGDSVCSVCRTAHRLLDLAKRLAPYQERVALGALRDAAGVLADLAEQAGAYQAAREGQASSATPGAANPEVSSGVHPGKSKTEKDKAEESSVKAEKGKTKEKKKKSHAKEKDVPSKKEKKGKSEGAQEEEEEIEEEEPRSEPEGRTSTASHPDTGRVRIVERPHRAEGGDGREPDQEELGLSRLPVRGSAGRHFDSGVPWVDPNTRRPAEPSRSPPRRESRGDHGGEHRERVRSRSREKGRWRGFRHYQRGKDHWKQFKKRKK
eukprot:Skav225231  [mRNA]  locus=scaffold2946:158123:158950:+ [translate_table: standard]